MERTYQKEFRRWAVILFVMITAGTVLYITGVHVCYGNEGQYPSYPPPVVSSPLFPCSSCHAGMQTDARKRELIFHSGIAIIRHGEPKRWCLDCHNAANRDTLTLLNGEKVEFKNSYLVCGQCHGKILNDWIAGVHGKRTGSWDGEKKYFLCSSCHNPHNPRFRSISPEPAPLRPEMTLRR